ncbi:MAG: glycosyltransferase family 4 protein [Methylomonas sp.]|nr:glycosyltransferase family 4 protein [Methylomonas sp.]
MKVVIATPFYPPEAGVLGMYAQGIEGGLSARSDEVAVVVFSRLRLPPGLKHIVYCVQLMRAASGADYILALDPWSVGMPALFASMLCRVPLVARIGGDYVWEAFVERTKKPVRLSDVYSHRDSFSFKERMVFSGIRLFVRRAQTLFFNTRFQIDLWHRVYGLDVAKARVLENYVPPRSRPVEEPEGRIFVSAGRLIALKNHESLQTIVSALQKRHPDITLDTRLLGRNEHQARLARAYAVIIPSLSEVSSNSAIDAVLAGKPFIMSDDTGTKERLGECGLFIDTRSETELAKAIETTLNPAEYARLSEACRAFSFVHTWDDIAAELRAAL